VRAGHGYRLDVDPEQVDRGRFERALRSARSQSGAAAVAGYAEALAVWRGPVLVDLGQPLREHPAAVAAAMLRATAVAEAVDVPNLLPADLTAFAGRAGKLAQLDGFLADRDAASGTPVVIVAVSGTAGVGKTALVVHWAHHVGDAFPDGRLYVNLRGYDPSER